MELLQISWQVVAPIFVMIGAGYAVQKYVGFDGRTLVKLNFWVFTPAFLFSRIVSSSLSAAQFLKIALHFVILFALIFGLAWFGAHLLGAGDRLKRALTATVLFYNSGNYGVPVARLAFPSLIPGTVGIGEQVQAITIMLQNVSNFTFGLALVAGGKGRSRRETLRSILSLPMVYTLVLAWAWRATTWPLPAPIDTALKTLSEGLVPVALITLGVQMATLKSHPFSAFLAWSLVLRLIIGPILGLVIVLALGVRGELAQAIVVSTSFPTAVNAALIAIEFDNEPEFAAAAVFYSTLLSALTVSLVIYGVRHLPILAR